MKKFLLTVYILLWSLIPMPLPIEGKADLLKSIKLIDSPVDYDLNLSVTRTRYIQYWNDNYEMIAQIPDTYRILLPFLCFRYDVPLEIVVRLIWNESQWISNAVSRRNVNGTRDYGLMQLNSDYHSLFAKSYYTGNEPFDPLNHVHNLEVGVKHLAHLYEQTGSWEKAVMAYNAGIGNVRRGTVPKQTILYTKRILGS